ncbi:RWD domain-containing [Cryptosporidium sp. chipmunk genotype I]|uniref:RWD domain-containing n=1 Tax=Cryptosporidium sp. chipmunk genotype I TaxID=1280935 RepID=UPI00351A2C8E|nr:RWD domain-containing [Cryptosporidium sp. chipmunk genotype I]
MDDLNLELEALQAIYSDKELTIETKENRRIINIQLIKEANCEIKFNSEDDESIKFIIIKVAFLINQDYPEKSPPEINNVNISILDGKYSMNECPLDNYHDQEIDNNRIIFDDSTCIYINVDEVINYYNSLKENYIGRVCLFDIIENLQVFIDDITSKLISNQGRVDDAKFGLNLSEKEDEEEEVIYSGLTERILCPVEERVSEEQFNLWKMAFKTEMIEKKIWKDENQDSSQLTGKQLFEKDESLIKSDENSSTIIDTTDIL